MNVRAAALERSRGGGTSGSSAGPLQHRSLRLVKCYGIRRRLIGIMTVLDGQVNAAEQQVVASSGVANKSAITCGYTLPVMASTRSPLIQTADREFTVPLVGEYSMCLSTP